MADRSKMASEQRTEHMSGESSESFRSLYVRLRQVPPVIAEKYKETALHERFGVLNEVFATRQG